ncbi:MAG: hypothetical protein K6V36_05555 [Anaerolineae bacterium]|nr:hypothetical protein [Anaerolineae bacterium]
MPENRSCCRPAPEARGKGLLAGLAYGVLPHTFCILFIVLSIIGATAATSLVKRVLYLPYLLPLLVGASLLFATLSALLYLQRSGMLSVAGMIARWRYLSILYGTTIAVNLVMFTVVLPAAASVDVRAAGPSASGYLEPSAREPAVLAEATAPTDTVRLDVAIPCPGHAPLIVSEVESLDGVIAVRYIGGSDFIVRYDPGKLRVDHILALEVFRAFRAVVRP